MMTVTSWSVITSYTDNDCQCHVYFQLINLLPNHLFNLMHYRVSELTVVNEAGEFLLTPVNINIRKAGKPYQRKFRIKCKLG